jgi:hypothetical protein
VLAYLNDVWSFQIVEDDTIEDDNIDYKDLNIKLDASNSIHILGEIKGSNIELTSKYVVILGTVTN